MVKGPVNLKIVDSRLVARVGDRRRVRWRVGGGEAAARRVGGEMYVVIVRQSTVIISLVPAQTGLERWNIPNVGNNCYVRLGRTQN